MLDDIPLKSARVKKPTVIEDLGYEDKDKKSRQSTITGDVLRRAELFFSNLRKNPSVDLLPLTPPSEAMPLKEIERLTRQQQFGTFQEVITAIRRLFSFGFQEAASNHEKYVALLNLSVFFEELVRDFEKSNEESSLKDMKKHLEKMSKDIKDTQSKNYAPVRKYEKPAEKAEKPLTTAEKNQLLKNIKELSFEQLKGVVTILRESYEIDEEENQLEINLEKLSAKTSRELEKYAKNCLKERRPQQSTPVLLPKKRKAEGDEDKKIDYKKIVSSDEEDDDDDEDDDSSINLLDD